MNDGEWQGPVYLLLAGTLFFPAVYRSCRYILTHFFGDRLQEGDICILCEKCTCSLQAVISFVVGAIIVSNVDDIMKDVHWLTNTYAYFGLPYFLHDIWAMFHTFVWNASDRVQRLSTRQQIAVFARNRSLLIAHHVIMPLIIFPVLISLRDDRGDFFVGTFYMIEVTIPFISARACLAQLNMKTSPLYIIAGLLMLFSFFCVRILVFPYLYWRYAIYANISFWDVPFRIPIKCNLGCLMIFVPQVYWFGLMVKGALRYFGTERAEEMRKER